MTAPPLSRSDAFGSRPTLSGNLQASTQVWTSAAGLVGPVVGGEVERGLAPLCRTSPGGEVV